jgi:hypothetical protein
MANETKKARAGVTPGEARRTLKARREHSKGDGNFPSAEPRPQLADERPEDRTPRDVPHEQDDRSAPKGNVTDGQEARNPDLEMRDDFKARRKSESGFARAERAARTETKERERKAAKPKRNAARPTARRSSAAKRDAVKGRERASRRAR